MPGDNKTPPKFHIRVDLDKEDEKKFAQIQEKYKLKNKSEVLRFCLNKIYDGTVINMDDAMITEIKKTIANPYIRLHTTIRNVDDFIFRAMSEYYDKLRKMYTLKDWNIRTSLPEPERDVANALYIIQAERPSGVTITDLNDYLNRNDDIIQLTINKFLAEGLLESSEIGGKIYYNVR